MITHIALAIGLYVSLLLVAAHDAPRAPSWAE
jgi:hypothetical protein